MKLVKTCNFSHLLDKIKLYFLLISKGFHICLKLDICVFACCCARVHEFYGLGIYTQREVHHGHRSLRHKRLKEGDINRKAVGERKAEIERRCAAEREDNR